MDEHFVDGCGEIIYFIAVLLYSDQLNDDNAHIWR